MNILAIESSCDETAAAVVRDGRTVLSGVLRSQTEMHAVYGGVVPEIAARGHIEAVTELAEEALRAARLERGDIDAVAVTYAPGLIGALLVGVGFAKAAAYALNVPLIPVHHLRGHIAANYIAFPGLEPPFLALMVSGGNTLLVDVRGYTEMRVLGGTRDDAAGECFDKVARVLGLGYPGGRALDDCAAEGDDKAYSLPRPQIAGAPFDVSFSGLKTAVIDLVHNASQRGEGIRLPDLAASFSAAVSDILVPRTMAALGLLGYDRVVAAGGVAANSRIRADLLAAARLAGKELFLPPLSLCGDNAEMIGAQGYYEYMAGVRGDMSLNARAVADLSENVDDFCAK